jgi:hypothetical protein
VPLLAGALVVLATLPLGTTLGAAQELISVAALVAALLVIERRVPAATGSAVGQDSQHDPAE